MKVLLVNGSPNREGCTYVALNQIRETLKNEGIYADIYRIGHKDIRGCIDCRKCSELGKCLYDDEVNSFVEMAEEYDGYIFGGPVYYGTVNPTLTNFMTRVFFSSFFGGKRIFRLKPAAAVASARRAGTMTAIDTINRFFTWAEMPIISSTYWNVIYGTKAEEALQDREGLLTMHNLARNMAWFLKIKQLSIEEGVPLPE
ncbi:flavodoxin family protein [Methanobrevibacter sp.]|uniref:flavodoxin family protein n=1 Tax=Methanobrevibacter sp. TaxID=66852 RepID=UPI0025CB84EC|nr:flavodoxin family protein [Methanobrevibacter sp.]MBQ6100068.1 flavodoxin family protein [Methanobrevibacter sp.]MBQ6511967.1 flavodoxin family protein [Methanobrevibacter sp.]